VPLLPSSFETPRCARRQDEVGVCSSATSLSSRLLRLARKRNLALLPRQNNPPAKSPKTLSSPSNKNIPLHALGKSVI
jgi:hypothetical protein